MELTVSEKIKLVASRLNISMSDLAKSTNQSRQNLSNKMKRNSFNQKDMEDIATALGCSIEICFTLPNGEKL